VPRTVTLSERPELGPELAKLEAGFPELIHHDAVVSSCWNRLYGELPGHQLLLVDDDGATVIGEGCTIPVPWSASELAGREGVRAALRDGLALRRHGGSPRALCALLAVVDRRRRGRGLSALIVEGMRRLAVRDGLEALVAPVRPTRKPLYPLVPMERYMRWRRDDGLLFDPWLRVHERLGARVVAVAPRSMLIEGTVAEWEEWTEIALPESGRYVVPGAFGPIAVDRALDRGRYEEANVWMVHDCGAAAAGTIPPNG
jgi:hypothetical protein